LGPCREEQRLRDAEVSFIFTPMILAEDGEFSSSVDSKMTTLQKL
jgi:hypothetical protein